MNKSYSFITANEDLSSGLLQSQMVRPVFNEFGGDAEIVSVNRPFSTRVNRENISNINLLIPPRLLAYNIFCIFYLPWAGVIAVLLRVKWMSRVKGRVVVARGYLPGLVAFFLSAIFGIEYVFDPRSLYPLESTTANRMQRGSIPFRFWVICEGLIIKRASQTIVVSEGMLRYYRLKYRVNNCVLIPCYGGEGEISSSLPSRDEFFSNVGLAHNKITLLYFGSLNNGWNNIDLYDFVIGQFAKDTFQFLIVSQDSEIVRHSKVGVRDNVVVTSSDSLPKNLTVSDCFVYSDFGMLFMRRADDWYTRLGVKFADYTCRGLPVLANKWVGGACQIIRSVSPPGCRILDINEPVEALHPLTLSERQALASWAQQHFAGKNINKIR